MSEIQIIEESRMWMVVNKPAGLPTHKTDQDEPDLLTAIAPQGGLHAVHRLDRDTSGLVLLAKNKEAARDLMHMWATNDVTKIYTMLLKGIPTWDKEIWNKPLSDRAEGHQNPQGPKNIWKDCRTEVKILEKGKLCTLAEATLITGRKHQIRRHAALAGFPLIGDDRYGKTKSKWPMALHASRLKITYKGLPLAWECQPPEWFSVALAE